MYKRSLFFLVIIFSLALFAQNKEPATAKDAAELQALNDARSKGFTLPTGSNLSENVTVEAVLLPYQVCKRIFGKDIAKNYTAIEVTISNRSRDAGLVIQSVYIDYNNWLLSGSPSAFAAARPNKSATKEGPREATLQSQPWQAGTKPGQVASVEYRVARGELLDAQMWTTRNWVIRSLQAIGSIASGYQFAFSERGIARGIASFNGQVVPAAQLLWPDETINQLNRISDFGYQTNKLIPQESADLLVAFFPIDRFLTPGLKKIFLKSPAAFFVPGSMIADPEVQKTLKDVLTAVLGSKKASTLSVQTLMEDPDLTRLLDGLSLNNIRVMITGVLTANIETIPATIDSVDFSSGNTNPDLWQKIDTDQAGVIKGRFLEGGVPSIVEAEDLGITNVAKVEQGSTNQELHFTFRLTKPIPSGTHLHFQVLKEGKDKEQVPSTKFDFVPTYVAKPPT